MKYCIDPVSEVILPIVDSDSVFPVRRVYCVGRNYAAHAREMGDDPSRDLPFFFCKDRHCILPVTFEGVAELPYPLATEQLEYEVELVVALGKGGKQLSVEQASECVLGYSVGLDMTRRDLQAQAKAKGRPWEAGKAFADSAPLSPIVLRQQDLLQSGRVALSVNGEMKQESDLTHLTWSIAEVIAKLSEQFELFPGDLIMTGTPENVGPVVVGDRIEASVAGVGVIRLQVVE
ncbi:fumarylacetoacetate hydrolase family protein [Marinomonas ostreistagni]|uniref:fumarylacetoacetate hydrolase family protein n=1 Tax=Marinomonas ostreistagni TaxID=359209 RepID=UPI00194F5714|nr:fumarylacetoacetate hydrolase family protein [Marinomonas ostreistagni]MBM6551308.1 fumarylacetoacetate hydrolase family protein [Marinomonas ostreistagni]